MTAPARNGFPMRPASEPAVRPRAGKAGSLGNGMGPPPDRRHQVPPVDARSLLLRPGAVRKPSSTRSRGCFPRPVAAALTARSGRVRSGDRPPRNRCIRPMRGLPDVPKILTSWKVAGYCDRQKTQGGGPGRNAGTSPEGGEGCVGSVVPETTVSLRRTLRFVRSITGCRGPGRRPGATVADEPPCGPGSGA
jgi:hypothetical protein